MVAKLVALVLFVVVTVAIGLYSRRKVRSMDDFFLGSRSLGPWMSAFAYGTSYFSAVVFVGYAGKFGWGMGISTIWIALGNALLGCLLAWLVLGRRTRSMTHRLNVSTMPEFFSERYGSRSMKIVAALVIFLFLVPYTASIYKGLGFLFEHAFGLPVVWVILGMSVLTAVYLLLGGYVATAINDFVQGIIMIGGAVLMVVYVLSHPNIGGVSAGIAALAEYGAADGNNYAGLFGPAPLRLLGLVILTSFGTWGMPQMIHKFYAIRDEKAIRRGAVISTLFALIIGGAAYFTGAFGRVFLNNTPPEAGMDAVVPLMLAGALPDALFGVILVLMLSASMSTLASLVLVSSSVISIDLVKGFVRPGITQKGQMGIMRACCAVFILLSFLMAIWPNPTVDVLMALSWGLVSGMFLAPYLFGLLWKGTTRAGAWAGFATGFLTMAAGIALEMPKVGNDFGKLFMPGIASVAMVLSVVAVPVVSLLTKKHDAAHLEKVFGTSGEDAA